MDFTLSLTGTSPLLMHSAQLSDPLNSWTKQVAKVSGKRRKTDDDHEELARLEHRGGMYFDSDFGPYIPGANIEATLFRGASKHKLMSALKTALIIPEEVNPLAYDGPRDADGLWKDKRFVHRASVKVSTSRVIRTRPMFPQWGVTVTGMLDTEVIDPDQFETILDTAGRMIGLGDWRPRFGRFEGSVKFE